MSAGVTFGSGAALTSRLGSCRFDSLGRRCCSGGNAFTCGRNGSRLNVRDRRVDAFCCEPEIAELRILFECFLDVCHTRDSATALRECTKIEGRRGSVVNESEDNGEENELHETSDHAGQKARTKGKTCTRSTTVEE